MRVLLNRLFADVARVLFRADGKRGQAHGFVRGLGRRGRDPGRTGAHSAWSGGGRRRSPGCHCALPVFTSRSSAGQHTIQCVARADFVFHGFGPHALHRIGRIEQAPTGLGGKLLERDERVAGRHLELFLGRFRLPARARQPEPQNRAWRRPRENIAR